MIPNQSYSSAWGTALTASIVPTCLAGPELKWLQGRVTNVRGVTNIRDFPRITSSKKPALLKRLENEYAASHSILKDEKEVRRKERSEWEEKKNKNKKPGGLPVLLYFRYK